VVELEHALVVEFAGLVDVGVGREPLGTIPPPPTDPPDLDGLTALAAEYGIEILGPPGIPS
jgi:hypothetical protein